MPEVITSPNGLYSVKLHDDFGEIGMGSPIYGTLTLQGAQGNLPHGPYGETILVSPDSRFVAVERLSSARPYQTQLLVVEFPRSGAKLRLAANTDSLIPVDLNPGRPVRITATREETTITARQPDGSLQLENGQTAVPHTLWPLELEGALLERLALGDLDEVKDFLTRLSVLHLLTLREADGLGSFLGGRVRLFPHQLYVAERARCELPVTQLELELQAEVDKFVMLVDPCHGGFHPRWAAEVHRRLYERVRYAHPAGTECGDRYRMANDLAARFAGRLASRFTRDGLLDLRGLRGALRRFYRAGQTEKIELAQAA